MTETWRRRQTLRLDALLGDAALRSPLYRDRLSSVGHEGPAHNRLRCMRPASKRELMQRFDKWVADPALALPALRAFVRDRSEAFLGRYLISQSSGSSGEPALFVQDKPALAVADMLEAARGPASLAGQRAAARAHY
jgi:phenylacetate-CoA ligase